MPSLHGPAIDILTAQRRVAQSDLDVITRRLDRTPPPSDNPLDCRCSYSSERRPGEGTQTRRATSRSCPVHAPDALRPVYLAAQEKAQSTVDRLTASINLLVEADRDGSE